MTAPTLEALGAALEACGAPWAVIGGHAVNAWLEPRLTADLDVTIAASPEVLADLRTRLSRLGLSLSRELGAAQPSGPDFLRFTSQDGSVVLELQAAKTPIQRDLLRRAVRRGPFSVATPEDLLVLKLIAFRTKDQPDLAGLVRLAGLDWPYVEGHAKAWGVMDRLLRLRDSLGP